MTLQEIDFLITFLLKVFGLFTLLGTTFIVVYIFLILQSIQNKISNIQNVIELELQKVRYEHDLMKSRLSKGVEIAKLKSINGIISAIKTIF